MKKIFYLSFLFISTQLTAGQTIYEQIKAVNGNWESIGVYTPALTAVKEIHGEKELIQTHLSFVIDYLKNKRLDLSEQQQKKRIACINTLKGYMQNGVFPVNTYHKQRQPYFIDTFGTYCAVGFLLKQTGYGKVAQKIHDEMNYAYVKQIPESYLSAWANEHGFMVDELALIQPDYVFADAINDTFFIGKNTATKCPILNNDICATSCTPSIHKTIELSTGPLHGNISQVNIPGDTFWVYTPDSAYIGFDSANYIFTYTVWGCGTDTDTATVFFNVLSQPGSFVSFVPGDGNRDGYLTNIDVLHLAKNMGETGPLRIDAGTCYTNYGTAWNTSYLGANSVSSDVDGNGLIDGNDFDRLQDCLSNTGWTWGQYSKEYYFNILPYDSEVVAGKPIIIPFTIKDTSGSHVRVKALTMEFYENGAAKHDFLAKAPTCNVLNRNNPKQYSVYRPEAWDTIVYSGALALTNSINPVCELIDTFFISINPFAENEIRNSLDRLSYKEAYALDAQNKIIFMGKWFFPLLAKKYSGLSENGNGEVSIYPNPATSHLTISLITPPLQSLAFNLYDLTGRFIQQQTLTQQINHVELVNTAKGIYFYNIASPQHTAQSGKLIIE